jgi:hypothetical protein
MMIHLVLSSVVLGMYSANCAGVSMWTRWSEGLSIMVGDNVKDTVSPGLEWVSNGLKHSLHFFNWQA